MGNIHDGCRISALPTAPSTISLGLPAQISGWALRLPVHSQTEVPTREIRETLWTPWTPPGGGSLEKATTCDPWDDPPTKLMIYKRIYIYIYYIILYIYMVSQQKHTRNMMWSMIEAAPSICRWWEKIRLTGRGNGNHHWPLDSSNSNTETQIMASACAPFSCVPFFPIIHSHAHRIHVWYIC